MQETTLSRTELTVHQLNQSMVGYRVLREVGHGSMGVVYEAVQSSVGRRVAIKVLPPNMALRDRTVRRFLREAEAMGRLSHHNIVDIHEVGSLGTLHYFSMQFVEGPPLDRVLKAGPLAIADVLDIGYEVASALAHAHARGVLHRDVKPSNLLRDGDRVVLTDFGLARPLDQEEAGTMTESGDLVGTPLYMSPEQISGEAEKTDARSDVWGLGATLYELLTQRPPFLGTNAQSILNAILHKDPPLLRKVRDDVPRDLEAVVLKCLEKDVSRRYSTAGALAEDLKAVREGRPVSARTPRFFDPAVRWVRRHPVEALVGIALIVVAFFLANSLLQSADTLKTVSSQKATAEKERGELQAAVALASARAEFLSAQQQWQTGGEQEKVEAFDRMENLILLYEIPHPDLAIAAMEVFASWGHERAQTDWTAEMRRIHEQYKRINPTVGVMTPEMFYSWIRRNAPEQYEQSVRKNEEALVGEIETVIITRQDPARAPEWRAAMLTGLSRFEEALRIHAERSKAQAHLDPDPWLDSAKINRRLSAARRDAGDITSSNTYLMLSLMQSQRARTLAIRSNDPQLVVETLIERARTLLDLNQLRNALADIALALRYEEHNAAAGALRMACERRIEELSRSSAPELVRSMDDESGLAAAESLLLERRRELESAGRGLKSVYKGLRDLLVAPAEERERSSGQQAGEATSAENPLGPSDQ